MTDTAPHGELERALRPLATLLGSAARWLHWPILALVLWYAFSGTTRVQPNEVAIVLRFGRVIGEGPDQIHGPGLLWALPRPIDEVVRVQVDRVHEVRLDELRLNPSFNGGSTTLDPRSNGYCLTGDHNILHPALTVRYKIADALRYALWTEDPERVLRSVALEQTLRTVGEVGVDHALTDRRRSLPETLKTRCQDRLDDLEAGLEVVAVEFRELHPPEAVFDAFWDVTNARAESHTLIERALYYQATEIPAAEAVADRQIHEARMFAATRTRRAEGEARAFSDLLVQYKAHPEVVKERLYRETIEAALKAAGSARYLHPPVGERYNGLRITVPRGR